MHLNLLKRLTTLVIFTILIIGIGNRAASADSAEQHNSDSQINHEQMLSDEHQIPMQECSIAPDANINHEQMNPNPDEHKKSMQKCSETADTDMSHQQMNSDEHQMPH